MTVEFDLSGTQMHITWANLNTKIEAELGSVNESPRYYRVKLVSIEFNNSWDESQKTRLVKVLGREYRLVNIASNKVDFKYKFDEADLSAAWMTKLQADAVMKDYLLTVDSATKGVLVTVKVVSAVA